MSDKFSRKLAQKISQVRAVDPSRSLSSLIANDQGTKITSDDHVTDQASSTPSLNTQDKQIDINSLDTSNLSTDGGSLSKGDVGESTLPISPISFEKTTKMRHVSEMEKPKRSRFRRKAPLNQESPVIIPRPLSPQPSSRDRRQDAGSEKHTYLSTLSSTSDITSSELTTTESKDAIETTVLEVSKQTASNKPWYMMTFDELISGNYEALMARPKPLTIEEVNWRCRKLVEQIQCLEDDTASKQEDIKRHRQRIKAMIRLNNSLDTELNNFKKCGELYNVVAEKELRQRGYRYTVERSMERRIKNYYDNRERQELLAKQIEQLGTEPSS